jgi:glycopeptide antibiotics resistance protein
MGRVNGRVQPLVLYTAAVYPFRINWIPLVRLRDFSRKQDLLLNVVGNAVMFIPSGIILPVVYPRLNRFWKVLLAGIGLSLAIELLQLPFSVRASDVDDLLLNTLGAILGYGIYAAVRAWKQRSK